MTMRWFLEEIAHLQVVSRFDIDQRIAEFTYDGGVTWKPGDRAFDYRWGRDMSVEEITEDRARELLSVWPPSDRAVVGGWAQLA